MLFTFKRDEDGCAKLYAQDVPLVKLGRRAGDPWEWLGSAPSVTERHIDEAIEHTFEFGFWHTNNCGQHHSDEVSVDVEVKPCA